MAEISLYMTNLLDIDRSDMTPKWLNFRYAGQIFYEFERSDMTTQMAEFLLYMTNILGIL